MSEKLSPEAREKLAAKLRERLNRERPRRVWGFVALAVFVMFACIGLWLGTNSPPGLPPIMLVCFDDIAVDFPRAEAQLVAPGHPDTKLEGFEIEWRLEQPEQGRNGTSKTDALGVARFPIVAAPKPLPVETVRAAFIPPRGDYRRDAQATVLMPPAFADVDLVVAYDDLRRATTDGEPTLQSVKRVVYGIGPVDATRYREAREWIWNNTSGRWPTGPLVRMSTDEILNRLGPASNAKVWKPTVPK